MYQALRCPVNSVEMDLNKLSVVGENEDVGSSMV